MQHTVNAVPHVQLALGRLDVDVRGAVLDRLADEQVHEPDDRCIILLRFLLAGKREVSARAFLLQFCGEIVQLTIRAKKTIDRTDQVGALSDNQIDLQPCCCPDIINGEDIARIHHRES